MTDEKKEQKKDTPKKDEGKTTPASKETPKDTPKETPKKETAKEETPKEDNKGIPEGLESAPRPEEETHKDNSDKDSEDTPVVVGEMDKVKGAKEALDSPRHVPVKATNPALIYQTYDTTGTAGRNPRRDR